MSQPKEEPQSELLHRMSKVVGHEVRNPLAVIKNSAYYVRAKLANSGNIDPKVEKHLAIIESEIARADRIIGDLSSFARPGELNRASMELNDVVLQALGAFSLPPKVIVEKRLAAVSPKASIDSAAIGKALTALLNNAAEAMSQGGTIKVSTSAAKGQCLIEVRDGGPGFLAADKEKLFLPFFTTKPRGLGLGLSGALKTALAHQGRLEAETSAAGAVFRIVLPLG